MAKAARVSASVPVLAAASKKAAAARADWDSLFSLLLFCGLGLLISLGVLLLGVPFVWS
jgi:hypothetical protein